MEEEARGGWRGELSRARVEGGKLRRWDGWRGVEAWWEGRSG